MHFLILLQDLRLMLKLLRFFVLDFKSSQHYMGHIFLDAYSAKNWSFFCSLWGIFATTSELVPSKPTHVPEPILRPE